MARTKRKFYFRGRRRPTRSYGWHEQGQLALSVLTGAVPESGTIILKGNSMYASGTNVIDWSKLTDLVIERIVLTFAVTVTATATKALIRYLFGLRMAEMDADDNIPALARPSLFMVDEDDKRTDWMYTSSKVIHTLGDATQVYTTDPAEIKLDFKPKRKLARDTCLYFGHAWQNMDTTAPDATFAARMQVKVLLSRPGGQLS